MDDGRGNQLFAKMAFGGKPPADLVPTGVTDPRKVYAEDVQRLEGAVLEACRREFAQDQVLRPAWVEQCRREDNSERSCGCFYDQMKVRLSGEAWDRFRRIIANDATTIIDGLPNNALGDSALSYQLEFTRHIPAVKLQCGM